MPAQSDSRRGRSWAEILRPYEKPSVRRALFQMLVSSSLFVLLWYLMLRSLEVGYWLTLLLAPLATVMVTRLFIIQHDCGHGSFLPWRAANHWIGRIVGVITLTPYQYWRRTHAIHHATHGDLDRRSLGDVETWTVQEYMQAGRWRRLGYRLYRNMFVMLGFGGFYQFVLKHRLPLDIPWSWRREWNSVLGTNIALGLAVWGLIAAVGWERFLMVQLPITLLTGILGIWLFYVQHQFEDTYWAEHEDWSFEAAGIQGSSFYDLGPILHWMTGNIGYHHIHHLSSRIPGYRLPECLREIPELRRVTHLRLWESLRCARLKLWDPERQQLIGFRELRATSQPERQAA